RHHSQAATAGNQHAQDVVLDAVVVHHDMVGQLGRVDLRVAVGGQIPGALAPFVGLLHADLSGKVHALESGKPARELQRLLFAGVRTRHDAAILRALLAPDARQPARVYLSDGYGAVFPEILVQRLAVAPVGRHQRQVTDDHPRCPYAVGFGVQRRGAGIADVGIGQRHYLACIGWIGKDLLVTGHGRIEDDLADAVAVGADSYTPENTAVGESKNGGLGQENLRKTDTFVPNAGCTKAGMMWFPLHPTAKALSDTR